MAYPFDRILLATEHTEFDSGAERLAFGMAIRCDKPLSAVVPVVSNPEYEAVAPQLAERAEHEAAARIAALREAASTAGIEIDISARRGEEPYLEIVEEARERQSDLIITRRRGKRSFLSKLLVGEMVSKVVGHAPCSVLFAARAAQMWSRGILAGVDDSPSAEHVARTAARIAAECGLPLTLLNVISHDTPEQRAQAEGVLAHMLALSHAVGAQAQSRIMTGKPFEQILSTGKEENADLLVVGRHGETNLIRTPFGGTTQKVIGLADTPVLVVRS